MFRLRPAGRRHAAPPHGWSSKPKGVRCLRCSLCGTDFSARRGAPLFRSILPPEKADLVGRRLTEGCGMRATARLCGVSLNTVLRFAKRAGDHAQEFHEQKVRHVPISQVQADEACGPCGKKKTRTVTAPPRPTRSKGAPRKKGQRLSGMAPWAADDSQPWTTLTFDPFGLHAVLQVKTQQALYYKAGGQRLLTIVLTRDRDGKRPDPMFYCTKLDWRPRQILAT